MKIIAFYLPQFHETDENNEWWGKGFTEWVNVKKAKPLFKNHYQPRIPLNRNYYNLLNEKTIQWQTEIASQYGVFGFCVYHYWFNGHLLLEKPLEIIRNSEQINFPYCICWANEDWTNAWVAKGDVKTLIRQEYGDKLDWENHFNYLLSFFKDPNYIVENNRPYLVIYRPEIITHLNEMLDYWTKRAIEEGFSGIDFAYQHVSFHNAKSDDSRFTNNIEYQPNYAKYEDTETKKDKVIFGIKQFIKRSIKKIDVKLNTDFFAKLPKSSLIVNNYSDIAERIINRHSDSKKAVAGMYVGWDNTPRRGIHGSVDVGSTPEIFEEYLIKQIKNVQKNYSNDKLFIFAWNEWAEGGYIEPDEKFGYGYLKAIKKAIEVTKE